MFVFMCMRFLCLLISLKWLVDLAPSLTENITHFSALSLNNIEDFVLCMQKMKSGESDLQWVTWPISKNLISWRSHDSTKMWQEVAYL